MKVPILAAEDKRGRKRYYLDRYRSQQGPVKVPILAAEDKRRRKEILLRPIPFTAGTSEGADISSRR